MDARFSLVAVLSSARAHPGVHSAGAARLPPSPAQSAADCKVAVALRWAEVLHGPFARKSVLGLCHLIPTFHHLVSLKYS